MAVPPEAGGATPVGEEGTLRPVLSGGISRFVLQRTSLRAADADYAGSSFVALYSRRVRVPHTMGHANASVTHKTPFQVDSRYTPIKPIGKGAYGVGAKFVTRRKVLQLIFLPLLSFFSLFCNRHAHRREMRA